MLAGLYSDNCTTVIEWLKEANPELAARCVLESGAQTPSDTLEKLRSAWLPRALAVLNLDNRKGVGLHEDGLPDIDWVEIPEGDFIFGEGEEQKTLFLPTFRISRYPITYQQFQAFIDAEDGIRNMQWWDGLAYQHKEPFEQSFKYWNHPRENVLWVQAIAFCRWLSARLGYEITLPTEMQWEKAARGIDGRAYPWGNEFDSVKCNTWESGIQQTTAVGMYPQGASPYGLLDMSGNVWEWCLNEYDHPENTGVGGEAIRAFRGGSWLNHGYSAVGDARVSARFTNNSRFRNHFIGFRVCPLYR